MRAVPLVVAILFFSATAAFAAEIREFDLKTIERLGNELTRVSQRLDRGATNPIRKRAKETAMQAVLPRLNGAYGAKYNVEVLNDPDGSGFLVYALAAFTKRDAVYTGGHFRITVFADGAKVDRIDDLSRGIIRSKADPGHEMVGMGTAQAVDTKYPVETWLYSSHLYRLPIGVATRDGTVWIVVNGKIAKVDKKTVEEAQAKTKNPKK